jgi:hypothetical protein
MDMHRQRYKLDTQSEERPRETEFEPYVRDFSPWSYRRLTQTRDAMIKLSNRYPNDLRHKAKLLALEAEITKRMTPTSTTEITEEEQLRRAEIVFARNSFGCVGKNVSLIEGMPMGEIDALFHRCVDGMNVYAVLEAKASHGGRYKLHKQLNKYGKVLGLLQPLAHIRAYKMIGFELTFVTSFGAELDYDFGDDLS